MKIENVAVKKKGGANSPKWIEFLKTLKKMKVGQSFLTKEKVASNHRIAMAMAPFWLGKRFSVQKVKTGYRIGCIETVKK